MDILNAPVDYRDLPQSMAATSYGYRVLVQILIKWLAYNDQIRRRSREMLGMWGKKAKAIFVTYQSALRSGRYYKANRLLTHMPVQELLAKIWADANLLSFYTVSTGRYVSHAQAGQWKTFRTFARQKVGICGYSRE